MEKKHAPAVESKGKAVIPEKPVTYGTPECVFPNIGPKGWCETHNRACITAEQYDEKIRRTLK